MNKTLRWGIIGLGKIAHHFANDLILADNCSLQAVASRSLAKAEEFRNEHKAIDAHGSYEEILLNPDVDIIYIATPHNLHKEWSIKAMLAGKHVLCEKPAGVNTKELKEMIAVAQEQQVFFMEALWSRFNPVIKHVLKVVKNGAIGEVKNICADFQFFADFPDDSRLFNPQLAGGATLDIGIYPLFLSYLLLGTPETITAKSIAHKTGVDFQTSVLCQYKTAFSNLYFALNSSSDMIASIYGEKGFIHIHGRWHESSGCTINIDGEENSMLFNLTNKGYATEAEACQKAIFAGQLQCPLWNHNDSLNLITMCDRVREDIGLVYPFE